MLPRPRRPRTHNGRTAAGPDLHAFFLQSPPSLWSRPPSLQSPTAEMLDYGADSLCFVMMRWGGWPPWISVTMRTVDSPPTASVPRRCACCHPRLPSQSHAHESSVHATSTPSPRHALSAARSSSSTRPSASCCSATSGRCWRAGRKTAPFTAPPSPTSSCACARCSAPRRPRSSSTVQHTSANAPTHAHAIPQDTTA